MGKCIKVRHALRHACLGCLVFANGCAALNGGALSPSIPTSAPAPTASTFTVQPAAAAPRAVLGLPAGATIAVATAAQNEQPPSPTTELRLDFLIEQVLARNPALEQMSAAWQAAQARYPQVTSLEDPMLAARLGPGSFGSNKVDFAYAIEVSQKIPFAGKRALRGEAASAEAAAARGDVEEMRLQLIESATAGYFDYFAALRTLEVNRENVRLLQEFRKNAETRYQTGLAPQQDILQADVDLAREQERRLGLEEARQIAQARLNTLMHLPPDHPLPPPPRLELDKVQPPSDVAALRTLALGRRPELEALANKIRAEQAALGLAEKEFCPDVELMAAYDAFWQEKELRSSIGVRINLPAYQSRRMAGLAEARAKIAQRSAEYQKQVDEIGFRVQEAFEKVKRSAQALTLYEKTILPAAKANVESAQAAYTTGKVAFLNLLEAQRNHANLREQYYETLAEYGRRRAALERAIGGPLPAEGVSVPDQASR